MIYWEATLVILQLDLRRSRVFPPAPLLLSHVADHLRQSEADVSGLLPAAADLSELSGHAGQEENQAAQQHDQWEDQDQRKSRGQVKMVLGSVEGTVPSE